MAKQTKQSIAASINKMEAIVNNPDVAESEKAPLRQYLDEAKRQFSEMEAAEKSDSQQAKPAAKKSPSKRQQKVVSRLRKQKKEVTPADVKASISKMQSLIDDPDTAESDKAPLRASLQAAQRKLGELNAGSAKKSGSRTKAASKPAGQKVAAKVVAAAKKPAAPAKPAPAAKAKGGNKGAARKSKKKVAPVVAKVLSTIRKAPAIVKKTARKKAPVVKAKLEKTIAKAEARWSAFLKEHKDIAKKYRNEGTDVNRDAPVKALPPGTRISEARKDKKGHWVRDSSGKKIGGRRYREYRTGHADRHRRGFPYLEAGGFLAAGGSIEEVKSPGLREVLQVLPGFGEEIRLKSVEGDRMNLEATLTSTDNFATITVVYYPEEERWLYTVSVNDEHGERISTVQSNNRVYGANSVASEIWDALEILDLEMIDDGDPEEEEEEFPFEAPADAVEIIDGKVPSDPFPDVIVQDETVFLKGLITKQHVFYANAEGDEVIMFDLAGNHIRTAFAYDTLTEVLHGDEEPVWMSDDMAYNYRESQKEKDGNEYGKGGTTVSVSAEEASRLDQEFKKGEDQLTDQHIFTVQHHFKPDVGLMAGNAALREVLSHPKTNTISSSETFNLTSRLADTYLAPRVYFLYNFDPEFRKNADGKNGKEYLMACMRHWSKEYLDREELKAGGRIKSALMRDRKYQSQQPHEQAYKRRTRPRHPHYAYAKGGDLQKRFEVVGHKTREDILDPRAGVVKQFDTEEEAILQMKGMKADGFYSVSIEDYETGQIYLMGEDWRDIESLASIQHMDAEDGDESVLIWDNDRKTTSVITMEDVNNADEAMRVAEGLLHVKDGTQASVSANGFTYKFIKENGKLRYVGKVMGSLYADGGLLEDLEVRRMVHLPYSGINSEHRRLERNGYIYLSPDATGYNVGLTAKGMEVVTGAPKGSMAFEEGGPIVPDASMARGGAPGNYQSPAQNKEYNWRKDKKEPAKNAGWRWTKMGANRLKKDVDKIPTSAEIAKFNGKKFTRNGREYSYLDYETRADKSDISRREPFLEKGGAASAMAPTVFVIDWKTGEGANSRNRVVADTSEEAIKQIKAGWGGTDHEVVEEIELEEPMAAGVYRAAGADFVIGERIGKDNFGREQYIGDNDDYFVDVDGVIHATTAEGEPMYPARYVVRRKKSSFAHGGTMEVHTCGCGKQIKYAEGGTVRFFPSRDISGKGYHYALRDADGLLYATESSNITHHGILDWDAVFILKEQSFMGNQSAYESYCKELAEIIGEDVAKVREALMKGNEVEIADTAAMDQFENGGIPVVPEASVDMDELGDRIISYVMSKRYTGASMSELATHFGTATFMQDDIIQLIKDSLTEKGLRLTAYGETSSPRVYHAAYAPQDTLFYVPPAMREAGGGLSSEWDHNIKLFYIVYSDILPGGGEGDQALTMEVVAHDRDRAEMAAIQRKRTPIKIHGVSEAYLARGGDVVRVPSHFGSGRNIRVYDYTTQNFQNAGDLVKEFTEAMEILDQKEGSTAISQKEALQQLAMSYDDILADEQRAADGKLISDSVLEHALYNLQTSALYNYRSGLRVKQDTIIKHVTSLCEFKHRPYRPESAVSGEDQDYDKDAAAPDPEPVDWDAAAQQFYGSAWAEMGTQEKNDAIAALQREQVS